MLMKQAAVQASVRLLAVFESRKCVMHYFPSSSLEDKGMACGCVFFLNSFGSWLSVNRYRDVGGTKSG